MVDLNCLTHGEPAERGGKCRTWCTAVDAAIAASTGLGDYRQPETEDCAWAPDRWPEPHAGVSGTDRDDDLLDITDRALARREIIIRIGGALHDALLVGNPAPRVKRMYDRLGRDRSRIGDLVVEMSALHGRDVEAAAKGFGILVAERTEWASTAAQWDEVIEEERRYHDEAGYESEFDPADLGPRQTDHAWYVQYGPKAGDVCRWTNCSFVSLPLDESTLAESTETFGTRDGNGVTLTRSDLVGSLADAGFTLRTP